MSSVRKRYEKLQAKALAISAELEDIADELDESFDNVPDNLKTSANAERLEQRADDIREQIQSLDDFGQYDWVNPQ